MKINFIGTGLFRSGGMRVIFEYANRLVQKGHDVVYYYPLKPYRFNYKENFYKKYYWNLRDYFKRNSNKIPFDCNFKISVVPFVNNFFIRDADATIATQWPTSYSLVKLKKSKGKKIYFIQGYETWNSDISSVDNSYRLPINKLTNSNFLRNLLNEKFNVEAEVIMNGIDYTIFYNDNKIFNEKINITFIDHYLELKGVRNALSVIEKLKENFDSLNFFSFGYRKYNKIPDFVTFIENPSDIKIAEIYRNTDIFIFTSVYEGFGLPPAEAMACKCAVVTSRVGAVTDYSVHMSSAIHVEPDNVSKLYESIKYLIENRDEIVRLSYAAPQAVMAKLNWEMSVNNLEKYILSH